jgi:uncharacterized membrane protein YjjP (DUF1212 family)
MRDLTEMMEVLSELTAFYRQFQASDLNYENAHSAFVGNQSKHDTWRLAEKLLSEEPIR